MVVRENNPLWPLPPDYDSLTVAGQWEARMSAMRLWYSPGHESDPSILPGIIEFFDYYYLWPDPHTEFNPLFYDDEPFPSPACHRLILQNWSGSRRSITAAPRGIGKTRLFAKSIMVPLLSYPGFSIGYAGASEEKANSMGDILRYQIYDNARIFDDFSQLPVFGNSIRPMRGERPTGNTHFFLRNGSEIQCVSATSRQRGIRPRIYALDDIEFDLRASSSHEQARKNIEQLLFKVVLPACTRPGVSVRWIGTMISKQHYIWHAMQTRAAADGSLRSLDPRFDMWSRILIKPIHTDPTTGIQSSCWPEMWPLTKADRLARSRLEPRLSQAFSLEEVRASIGEASWRSEYEQDPADSEEAFFPLNPQSDRFSFWFSKTPDDAFLSGAFWNSSTLIHWVNPDGSQASTPLAEFLRTSRVACFLDTSFTSGPDSDYKVCAIVAQHTSGALFVLDLWAAQCHEPELTKQCLLMCDRWRPATINPEVTSRQLSLYHSLEQAVRARLDPSTFYDYVPAVRPLRVGTTGKASKIAALKPYFENCLFKLPLHLASAHPWRMLIDQILNFYPVDESNTNLQKDDCIDTVALSLFIFRQRPAPTTPDTTSNSNDPLAALKRGETHDSDGVPHILRVMPNLISPDDYAEIRSALASTHGIAHIPSHHTRSLA
jgi:phage terminase large subunit-like protein